MGRYPKRMTGHWKTHEKQPILLATFVSVMNEDDGWIEQQLKPAISTEKQEMRHSVAMAP